MFECCHGGGVSQEENAVSLLASTITRRTEELGDNVYAQLQQKTKEFDFFSLALDERTDVQDTVQLLIFIRGVSANFEMCEELAALQSLQMDYGGGGYFRQSMPNHGRVGPGLVKACQHHN